MISAEVAQLALRTFPLRGGTLDEPILQVGDSLVLLRFARPGAW